MHKNPRPGLFDFERRSLRYTILCGLAIGFVLSVFVYIGLFLWRADKGAIDETNANAGKFEARVSAARRKNLPTPAPTAAVRF